MLNLYHHHMYTVIYIAEQNDHLTSFVFVHFLFDLMIFISLSISFSLLAKSAHFTECFEHF